MEQPKVQSVAASIKNEITVATALRLWQIGNAERLYPIQRPKNLFVKFKSKSK